jgi:PAS domain-containing protein
MKEPKRPIYANAEFYKAMGVEPKDMATYNFSQSHGPLTSLEDCNSFRRRLAEQKAFYQDIVNYRKDGTPFHNRCVVLFFGHNLAMGLQVSMGDIKPPPGRDPRESADVPSFSHSSERIADRVFNALYIVSMATEMGSEAFEAMVVKKLVHLREFIKGQT